MGILTNDQGGLSGQSSGALIGAVVGAVIGLLVPGASFATAALGAAETGAGPPVPRLVVYKCAPSLVPLVNPLVGLPFRLGSHDPQSGALDCAGVVMHLLTAGRGLTFDQTATGNPVLAPPLVPVWRQTGRHPHYWRAKCTAWNIVLWRDRDVEALLGWESTAQGMPLAHCGMVLSDEVLRSASLDRGVGFVRLDWIAKRFGQEVMALFRPPAVIKAPWQRRRADAHV